MQDIIRLLPESLANQIAAGEVVQRPASAVKEMLENSVDAGATRIDLIIKNSGKTLIQVVDDGIGMSITDARMCFERHATSKIKAADDLFNIRTFGFRGEAMASIAAVAQVELRTCREGEQIGTLLYIEGSEVKKQERIATPKGSSISVKNLFFNTPARRKFLKSKTVEYKHILEEFHRVALANPHIEFSFTSDDKEIERLPKGKLAKRIISIFGKNYQKLLIACQEEVPDLQIIGYIGKPEGSKKTRGEQFFFVNNRFIKYPYLHHAVMNAYGDLLPADSYPFYVIFIEIDPQRVDVNVHPTKTEVKFDDERTLYAVLRSAVRQALGIHNVSTALDFDMDVNLLSPQEQETYRNAVNDKQANAKASRDTSYSPQKARDNRNLQNWEKLYEDPASTNTNYESHTPPDDILEEAYIASTHRQASFTLESAVNKPINHLSPQKQPPKQEEQNRSRTTLQVRQRYLLSAVKSGIMLIDQQAAHERILYERYIIQLEKQKGASQQLLFPQSMRLDAENIATLQEISEELRALGFVFKPKEGQIILEGIPSELLNGQECSIFKGLLETYRHHKANLQLEKNETIARAMAKKAAIKNGTPLSSQEIDRLIDELFACQNPNYTADGKKVIAILEDRQIDSFFTTS
ncbi:MAG: DNA mismatch repair endonuclease MutL [Bernardetiaceae bacterium]|nr:DNA mismatch repair endonuclease MutL [Bernardetiaceae bacterium]